MKTLPLSKTVEGWIFDKELAGISPNTKRNYLLTARRLMNHIEGDPPLADITVDQVKRFLRHLQTTQVDLSAGAAPRPARTLSAKTIRNIHSNLSSLWSWAVAEGYAQENIIRQITPPNPKPPPIVIFERSEIRDLIEATKRSAPWKFRPETQTTRPELLHLRDKAIILFLLDTGVRASELCRLRIKDVQLKHGVATVQNKGRLDQGQGKKRLVEFGKRTRQAIWKYLAIRGQPQEDDTLFATVDGLEIDRRSLAKLIRNLGQRAGVKNCHPHRFRHTFATMFLEHDSNVYRLQQLMGHESLDMMHRYVHLAKARADPDRRISVADRWLR